MRLAILLEINCVVDIPNMVISKAEVTKDTSEVAIILHQALRKAINDGEPTSLEWLTTHVVHIGVLEEWKDPITERWIQRTQNAE